MACAFTDFIEHNSCRNKDPGGVIFSFDAPACAIRMFYSCGSHEFLARSIMLSPKRAFGSTPGTSGSTSFLHLWHHLRCTRYLIIFAGLMIRIVVTKRVLILAVLPFRGVLQSGHTSGISGSSLSRVLGDSRP